MRTPRAKSVLLLRREIEKPQGQKTRSIGDSAEHLAPAAERDLGEQHLAFHRRALARQQLPQRHHAGAILVAQRQQEQQILGGFHAERAQPHGKRCRRRRATYGDRLRARSQRDDALHFDLRAARQRGNADRGARRIRLAEVLRHDLVDEREVGEIGQEDVRLDHVVEARARRP